MLKRFEAEREKIKVGRFYHFIYDTEKMIEEINAYAKQNNLYIKQVVYFGKSEAVVLFDIRYEIEMPLYLQDFKGRIEE